MRPKLLIDDGVKLEVSGLGSLQGILGHLADLQEPLWFQQALNDITFKFEVFAFWNISLANPSSILKTKFVGETIGRFAAQKCRLTCLGDSTQIGAVLFCGALTQNVVKPSVVEMVTCSRHWHFCLGFCNKLF
jgi:hypothetical protein